MGSKTPPTTTQTTKQDMSPQQQQIFDLAFPYAKEYAGKPIQQFGETGIAGLDPNELIAQQKALEAATATGDSAAKAKSSNDMMMDPSFMLDVANNPYLKAASDAMTSKVTTNLNESILPGVRTGATMAGGAYSGGSTREGIAQGAAIGKTNEGLSNSIADMMFGAYNRGLTGMGEAINRNPSVQGQQLFEPGVISAVGAQNRGVEQVALDEEIRKFYTGQALPFLQAQELMSLIQGMPGGSTTSTATGSVPGVSPFMSAAGGAASGATIGSIFGPVGTGVGAGAGGLLSYLMNR